MNFDVLFRDKNILVTGGTGYIGSEIVRQVLKYNPRTVRVLDINETGLFNLEHELENENLRFFIGDVRDRKRLERAMENTDIVFHAAALKHVPLCEYNPFEALQTNAIGTQNVIDSAIEVEVEKVINISTDKAVRPTNVMGASKLLSEKLIISANYYKGNRKTIFSSVRFGNVLASSGSVIPLFLEQARRGRPITITDPSMTRFFMTLQNSINVLFKSVELMKGGEIFIFKMPAINLKDLADVIIEEFSPNYSPTGKIETKIIGNRPGEKYHEELMTEDEAKCSLELEDMFILLPEIKELNTNDYNNAKPTELKNYSSRDVKLLSKQEIRDMIKNN